MANNKKGATGANNAAPGATQAITAANTADAQSNPKMEKEDLVEAQRRFYKQFGLPTHIMYDLYPSKSTLARKLGMLFQTDDDKYKEKNKEKVQTLTEVIWSQRFYVGQANVFGVRMSPIFVFCDYDNDNLRKKVSYPLSMKSNKFSLHPVFRVQKCVTESADDRSCCAIFIDELGRVYEDWKDFTENNRFDDCVMLVPTNGIYLGDSRNDDVLLDVILRKMNLIKVLDASSVITGVVATGVSVAAIIPAVTLAPAVVVGATVTGVTTAAYTGIRSAYTLYDRSKHEQSIGLGNGESRSAWFNITTAAFVAGTAGASQILTKMLEKGKDVSRIAQGVVRGTQVGTFSMQTVGCVDGCYTIGKKLFDGEDFSLLEAAQLSTAIFLWSHSARNLLIVENTMKISGTKNAATTKRFMLTTQKTVVNTLLDHRLMFNAVREMDGSAIVREIQAVFSFEGRNASGDYDLSSGVEATVKVEYSRIFDTQLEKIVHKLDRHYKHNELSALKQCIIRFMCGIWNMTLKVFDHFIDYAHQIATACVSRMSEEMAVLKQFDFVLNLIAQRVKQWLRTKMMSYNDCMTGLYNGDRRMRELDEDIRDHVFATIRAHAWTPPPQREIAPEVDLTEAQKVTLALEDRVEDVMSLFEEFEIGDREIELRDTVTGVLRTLTPRSAGTFFNIVICLVLTHAENIAQTLNRSIPIDSFIKTAYCMLDMRKETERIESVLAAYNGDMYDEFETEFAETYKPVTDESKIKNCKQCSGKKCTK